jgi:type IV secretory pathway VirB2 component (pilin)
MTSQIVTAWLSISASLSDPRGSSPFVDAVHWLEGTLLGTVAMTVAIIAVAYVGVMMLRGRIDIRHGATVIGGCFILFGASSIVAGIQSTIASSDSYAPVPLVAGNPEPPPIVIKGSGTRPAGGPANDPYAGAAVPVR